MGHLKSRTAVVAVLLLLILGLAALLAWQVQIAAAYHRYTAEGVMRDYAGLAAARVASAANQAIYVVAQATIAAAEGSVEPPRDSTAQRFLGDVRFAFRLDPETRRVRVVRGRASAAEQQWIADTLAAAAGSYERMWYFAGLTGTPVGASPSIVLYRRLPNGQVTGGVADLTALAPVLAHAVDRYPLLPRNLTRGVQLDSAGVTRFTDDAGRLLHQSGPATASRFVRSETIAPWLAGLHAEVALRPEIASSVIAGGLPRSRLPMVLGVFAAAAALTVGALLLIRRESELARLRTELVAGVSHELRTPLAQIRMFSETLLLERVRSDDERRRSLAIIDQEARRLTHLVENLLHFSRAERSLGRVTPRPVDLAAVVRQAAEAFTPLAAARQVALRAEVPPTLAGNADADAVRQIVLNLLDNAVKYGPAGQTVTLSLQAVGGRARLIVDDEGEGIPPADRERIWERFFRLPRDRGSSSAAGTGIGLAVVRELSALHGGRAWVESAPTGGARFIIDWPLTGDGAGA